ncbi:MAG: hypothetical protein IPL16_12560 [Ignavibacteria bacterium]|nr:hypothetical protein [Ignavibacteria bacterium]
MKFTPHHPIAYHCFGFKRITGSGNGFLRLKRDVEIQNKILTTIIPILEQAKIEEKRETPTVIILDPPNVPDKK